MRTESNGIEVTAMISPSGSMVLNDQDPFETNDCVDVPQSAQNNDDGPLACVPPNRFVSRELRSPHEQPRSRSEDLHVRSRKTIPETATLSIDDDIDANHVTSLGRRSDSLEQLIFRPDSVAATTKRPPLGSLSSFLAMRGIANTGGILVEDDCDSASSSAYFAPSDFNPTNWMRAMDAYTFGFAVVALTTAVTHPLLFFAGALTAFGTARAAGAGYEFCQGVGADQDSSIMSRCVCWNPSLAGVVDESSPTETGQKKTQRQGDDEDTVVSSSSSSASPTANGAEESGLLFELPEQPRPQVKDQARQKSTATVFADPNKSEAWMSIYYPKLANNIRFVSTPKFFGLSAVEFFRVFFDDKAPYCFLEFQKKRGDIDIKYGLWKDLPLEGSLALYHRSPATTTSTFPEDVDPELYKERVITFKAKTNSYFGPSYASTTKTQRILVISKRLAVLECKTVLGDIPFCDRFFVMERWVIHADKEDHHYVSRLSGSCEVIFNSHCPFEQQIKTKSVATLTDVLNAWCKMAQEALKLAEEAKLDRLRHSINSFEEVDELDLEPGPDNDVKVELEFAQGHNEESVEVDRELYFSAAPSVQAETLIRSGSEPEVKRAGGLQGIRRSFSQLGRRGRASTYDSSRWSSWRKSAC